MYKITKPIRTIHEAILAYCDQQGENAARYVLQLLHGKSV